MLSLVSKRWLNLVKDILKQREKRPAIQSSIFQSGDWKFTKGKRGFLRDIKIEKNSFTKAFGKSLCTHSTTPSLFLHILTDDFFNHKYLTDNKCIIKSRSFTIDPDQHPEINRRINFGYASKTMSELLPKNSLQLFIIGDGFISKDMKLFESNDYEEPDDPFFFMQKEPKPSMKPPIASISFPKSSNFRFGLKNIINSSYLLGDIRTEKQLNTFFDVKQDERLRMIIIYSTEFNGDLYESQPMKNFIITLNNLRKRNQNNELYDLVITGKLVDDAYTNVKKREYKYINEEVTFLTLIGKKNKNDCVTIAQMLVEEQGNLKFSIR